MSLRWSEAEPHNLTQKKYPFQQEWAFYYTLSLFLLALSGNVELLYEVVDVHAVHHSGFFDGFSSSHCTAEAMHTDRLESRSDCFGIACSKSVCYQHIFGYFHIILLYYIVIDIYIIYYFGSFYKRLMRQPSCSSINSCHFSSVIHSALMPQYSPNIEGIPVQQKSKLNTNPSILPLSRSCAPKPPRNIDNTPNIILCLSADFDDNFSLALSIFSLILSPTSPKSNVALLPPTVNSALGEFFFSLYLVWQYSHSMTLFGKTIN